MRRICGVVVALNISCTRCCTFRVKRSSCVLRRTTNVTRVTIVFDFLSVTTQARRSSNVGRGRLCIPGHGRRQDGRTTGSDGGRVAGRGRGRAVRTVRVGTVQAVPDEGPAGLLLPGHPGHVRGQADGPVVRSALRHDVARPVARRGRRRPCAATAAAPTVRRPRRVHAPLFAAARDQQARAAARIRVAFLKTSSFPPV